MIKRSALLVLAACLAVVGLGAPASATTDGELAKPIKISKAALAADGAGLVVELDFHCKPAYGLVEILVRASQVSEFGVVTGDGYVSLRCDGPSDERARVGMYAWYPFTAAETFVTATGQNCSDFGCQTIGTTVRTVTPKGKARDRASYDGELIDFTLPKSGRIEAAGAGAVVKVPYTCGPLDGVYLWATLAEVNGDGTVTLGDAELPVTCTETTRSGVLAFHAGGGPWVAGDAFIVIHGDACSVDSCDWVSAYRTIKLK